MIFMDRVDRMGIMLYVHFDTSRLPGLALEREGRPSSVCTHPSSPPPNARTSVVVGNISARRW